MLAGAKPRWRVRGGEFGVFGFVGYGTGSWDDIVKPDRAFHDSGLFGPRVDGVECFEARLDRAQVMIRAEGLGPRAC